MVVGHLGVNSVHVVNHVMEEPRIEQGHVYSPSHLKVVSYARTLTKSKHQKKLKQYIAMITSAHVCKISEQSYSYLFELIIGIAIFGKYLFYINDGNIINLKG